ncbi:hypothetical protein [Nostoc sp. PA-18-2419]|uniref:hypothetical protein n=1 Tax=Nostoc sp. PA-18-2419 TaxID=2575443 RepID=UPI0016763957|nr:hypothetical protein [Nostoc sp. PA-18-2419]
MILTNSYILKRDIFLHCLTAYMQMISGKIRIGITICKLEGTLLRRRSRTLAAIASMTSTVASVLGSGTFSQLM